MGGFGQFLSLATVELLDQDQTVSGGFQVGGIRNATAASYPTIQKAEPINAPTGAAV